MNTTNRHAENEFLAKNLLIRGESPESFHALIDRIASELQPLTFMDWTLIEIMVAAKWRQIRHTAIRVHAEAQTTGGSLGFETMAERSAFIKRLTLSERRFSRLYNSTRRRYIDLRQKRRAVKNENSKTNLSLEQPIRLFN